jgi:hypothetical protein
LKKSVSGWHREPDILISNISSRHPEHRVAAYAKLRTDSRSHSALPVGRFLLSYVLHNTRARFFSFPCFARAAHNDFVLCIVWLWSHSARSVAGATSAVCSSRVRWCGKAGVNGTLAVQNVVAQVGHSSKLVLPIFLRIARLISEVLQYLSTYRPESAKVFTNREAQKASVRDWERTAETPKRTLRECVQ